MMTAGQLTDEEAYRFLEALRWPEGSVCPHCGYGQAYFLTPANGVTRRTRRGSMSPRRVWKCASCRKQFSVLTNTIFHGTKIPVGVLVAILAEGPATGMSVRKLAGRHPINPSTAQDLLQRIRVEL